MMDDFLLYSCKTCPAKLTSNVSGMEFECRECRETMYEDGDWVRVESTKGMRNALLGIASLGGNLTDDALYEVNGINDGRSRAVMYVGARQIALAALKEAS